MWRILKILLVITFLTFLGYSLIVWWSASVSPGDVRAYSVDDLRRVDICRNCQCVGLEPAVWPGLIRKVIDLKFTIGTGWKGEESQDLYEVEFDWRKNGNFGLCLWTRASLNGQVIATFQRKHDGGTTYYGDYSGDELKRSLDELAQPDKMLKKCFVVFPSGNMTTHSTGAPIARLSSGSPGGLFSSLCVVNDARRRPNSSLIFGANL